MKILKDPKPARVNVASTMLHFFLGGMLRARQAFTARRSVASPAKGSKYEPHQGKKECERRARKIRCEALPCK